MNALSKWMVGLQLVLACDAQTDAGYRGESLAAMRGVVARPLVDGRMRVRSDSASSLARPFAASFAERPATRRVSR